MRFVEISVPEGTEGQIREILDGEDVDYVVADATNDPYEATVLFPLPTEAVEELLESLTDVGIEEDAHLVIVDAEAVVSEKFEKLQEQYGGDIESEDQITNEELRAKAREFIPARATYVLLSVVSAVIATAGLLLNSPAIVVGSMVIAPLVGPAMATGVGTALFRQDLFYKGLLYQLGGLALTVVSATVFALLIKTLFLVPPTIEITAIEQISGRLTPDLLSLVVAIGAGIAGVRSLTSGISTGLVGVMIAAALIPPIAAVGIGVAWWLPDVIFNAGLLVLVNVISINLAALLTLRYGGYRPTGWEEETKARTETRRRTAVMGVVLLVLAGVLATFTVGAYQTATMTQTVQTDVEDVLDTEPYRELAVEDVQVEYREQLLGADPDQVTVTVQRPSGRAHPQLANRIDQRIERRLDRNVDTRVRFVDVQDADRQ